MKWIHPYGILVGLAVLAACDEPASPLDGGPDAAVDLVRIPDVTVPDTAPPDTALAEMLLLDMAPPEMALPDMPLPDLTLPDMVPPDMALSDQPWAPDKGPGCGDGVRQGTEQCDDGNLKNLDGCDASCKFEQVHRFNYLTLEYGTDGYCTTNAFGGAISQILLGAVLQQLLNSGVKYGEVTVLYKLLGLDDLIGKNDPALVLGWMTGKPVTGASYDGTSDLDWWYKADPAAIDAKGDPKDTFPGKISSGVLTSGPGSMALPLSFGGSPTQVRLTGAMLSVVVGSSSTPLAWTTLPRGHQPAEHLSPTLQSFACAGQKSAAAAGKLCGRITAASLQKVPVPGAIMSYCAEKYTAANSLLDVLVGGCTIALLPAIMATSPDSQDPAAPPVGAGPPYTLVAGANKKVSGCQDKSNKSVALAACLTDATYSAFFKFASGRVILK